MRSDRAGSGRSPTRSARARVGAGGCGRLATARSCLVALLLLAACSVPDDASVETGGDVPDDRRSSPQDERGDAQDGEGDALDDPGGTPPACPPPVLAGIEQTIGSQLDAFADDDVAGALGYASEAFRAQIDVASFERLIADAFPAVADPASFSIGGCHVEQASTQVLVGVVGADGGRMDLVYVMVEEAGRWAIDGARELATDRGMVA